MLGYVIDIKYIVWEWTYWDWVQSPWNLQLPDMSLVLWDPWLLLKDPAEVLCVGLPRVKWRIMPLVF
jgi:hypothetical protein